MRLLRPALIVVFISSAMGSKRKAHFFCCEHCAAAKGVAGLRDRVGAGGVIQGSRV
jgi:hypothetical protein